MSNRRQADWIGVVQHRARRTEDLAELERSLRLHEVVERDGRDQMRRLERLTLVVLTDQELEADVAT